MCLVWFLSLSGFFRNVSFLLYYYWFVNSFLKLPPNRSLKNLTSLHLICLYPCAALQVTMLTTWWSLHITTAKKLSFLIEITIKSSLLYILTIIIHIFSLSDGTHNSLMTKSGTQSRVLGTAIHEVPQVSGSHTVNSLFHVCRKHTQEACYHK